MIQLEWHNDQILQHDVWDREAPTPDEIEEYRSEIQSMIDDVRTELETLEDNLQESMKELEAKVEKCEECGEPLDDGECRECEAEHDILWA